MKDRGSHGEASLSRKLLAHYTDKGSLGETYLLGSAYDYQLRLFFYSVLIDAVFE